MTTTPSYLSERSMISYGLATLLVLIGLAGCDEATTSVNTEEETSITPEASKDGDFTAPGEVVQVTTDPADQMLPDISNNRVVYEDNRNGNWDIYLFCLDSWEECRISSNPADQRAPDISNGLVVWEDYRVESGDDIFLYDKSTQTERRLTFTAQPNDERNPEIEGDWAMWYHGFRWYYRVYSVSEDSLFTIGSTGPGDGGYGISGDRAVLTGYGGGDPSGIYLCDLTVLSDAGCEILIEEEGRQSNPDISGDYVIYQDDRNGNYDIFLYNLNSEMETALTADSTDQVTPVIDGNYVVWVDMRNGNDDLYMYNIETEEVTQITSDGSDQRSPAIFRNYIVWEDNRNGNWDIYMYNIPSY